MMRGVALMPGAHCSATFPSPSPVPEIIDDSANGPYGQMSEGASCDAASVWTPLAHGVRMSEPRRDVLKIHFSDNEPCDPRIATALRHIMEEAGVSRSAAARRLMALGCLALIGQDARQAADTVLRGKAREMWSIARLLQAGGQGSGSEASLNVICERAGDIDSSSARRADETSADNVDRPGRQAPETEPGELPHVGVQLTLSSAAVQSFPEDKQAAVSDRAENESKLTQPISKLSRVLDKFRDANKPIVDEPNE